uniref:Uncharacterized protein n=1 Tax=Arundo donax TaxID=35708 RepID=A0A0A9EWI1_ARUDO
MENLLGPGSLCDELRTGDNEDSTRSSLVPLWVVLDNGGANT